MKTHGGIFHMEYVELINEQLKVNEELQDKKEKNNKIKLLAYV